MVHWCRGNGVDYQNRTAEPCARRQAAEPPGGTMGPILFCDRCRGIQVGWNRKFIAHVFACRVRVPRIPRWVPYGVALVVVLSLFSTPLSMVSTGASTGAGTAPAESLPQADRVVFDAGGDSASAQMAAHSPISDPMVASVLGLLDQNSRMNAVRQARIARAVVASARKYDVDPYLVASVLLVESSGDPFAISNKDAVGIMQIHVPTWGALVDMEQINLFRIEDNIDLGTRILADYTARYGLSDGLMRYLGALDATEEALQYVARIEGIYLNRNAD